MNEPIHIVESLLNFGIEFYTGRHDALSEYRDWFLSYKVGVMNESQRFKPFAYDDRNIEAFGRWTRSKSWDDGPKVIYMTDENTDSFLLWEGGHDIHIKYHNEEDPRVFRLDLAARVGPFQKEHANPALVYGVMTQITENL